MFNKLPPLTIVKLPRFKSCPLGVPRSNVPPLAKYKDPIVSGPVNPGVTIVPPRTLIDPAYDVMLLSVKVPDPIFAKPAELAIWLAAFKLKLELEFTVKIPI